MASIDISKIKLFQLRAVLAVAECSSFGGAAAQLDLTQSAISHAIATLEDELGVSLFIRGRTGAALTHVGEQILPDIQQMLDRLEAIATKVNHARGLQTGQVKIASIRSLAAHWLPPVLAAFNQQFPQITVTLTNCFDYVEVQNALRNRTADVGLMDINDRSGLLVTDIQTDPYVVLVPASAPPMGDPLTWQQISQYPLLMPSFKDRGYDILRDYIAAAQVPLKIAYEINEDSTIVSMVGQGLGIGMLPYLAAVPVPDTVRICRPPTPLTRQLGAAILDSALHSPAVFVFIDTMKAIALKATAITHPR